MTDGGPISREVLVGDAAQHVLPRLNRLFELQAQAAPHAIALMHSGESLTYRELDSRANRLAHHLRSLGAGPEVTIGVCLPRNLNMVIALMAILKSGAAYVPLDMRAPLQRLEYMLEDSAAKILITPTPLIEGLTYSGTILDLDAEAERIAQLPQEQPVPLGDAENLAYIMYTSGSTGLPKGVMVRHTAANLVVWARDAYSPEDVARVAATTSLGFGPSVQEIFIPLCLGGTVLVRDNLLQPFSDDEQPTMLYGSPTVLTQLLTGGQVPESVRLINVGGEMVRGALIQRIYDASKVRRIFVHYGPTEATNCVTVASVPRSIPGDPTVGRPVVGGEIYILNADGQAVGDGEVGEIYIGGKNLARGYQNKAALTESSFVADPFAPSGGRMYRTGDLGRWSKTGDLECLGRIDDQVKISGVRIELKEIEAALLRLDAVRQAAVAVVDDAAGRQGLVAYIETDAPLVPRAIREALAAWLPAAMIPPSYIFLKKFPLNLSGKTDRASLLQIKQSEAAFAAHPVEPQARKNLFRRLQARRQRRRSPEAAMAYAVETAWRRILPGAPLGNDVSWTDAGGDSLGQLQFLLRLEEVLDRKLGFDLLSAEMTQRELIDRLLKGDVGIITNPSLPVVHLVPGILGDDPALAKLRREFEGKARFEVTDLPALEAQGTILLSLQETVRWVVQGIMDRQPTGSIILAGYSFGGIVAFDAAKQLLEAGRHVALLIILDTPTQIDPRDRFAERPPSERSFYYRVRGPFLKLAELDIARRALLSLFHLRGRQSYLAFRRLLQRNFRFEICLSWRPSALSVPAVVVLSEAFGPSNRLQWTRLLPNGNFIDLPGAHLEILESWSLAAYKEALLNAMSDAAPSEATS